MGNLTTVENVKGYLGITNSQDDALLERLVSSASGYIQTWLNRDFAVASYVDTFDGDGISTKYLVANYPIKTITSVTVDGQAIPAASSPTSTGYAYSDTRVVLRNYRFNLGLLNCAISYTAGFTSVPMEIEQACIEVIGNRYREKDRIGLVSKGLAGETITYSQKDFPDSVRTILSNYRKVIVN